MILTKNFTKALNKIFLISIGLAGISILMSAVGMSGFSISETNSSTRIVLVQMRSLLPIGTFWFFVAFLTKENKGALIAFLLKFISWGYITFQFLSHGFSSELYYLPNLLSTILAYVAFGLIYFKKANGLYLLLVFVLARGIGIASSSYAYYDILSGLLRAVGLRDIMEFRISTGENSYRPINLFVPFVRQMYLPLSLIIFWFVFCTIRQFKQLKQFDISFRTVQLFSKLSNLSFSVIFWTFRLPLFISVFGIISYMDRVFIGDLNFDMAFSLVCFCFAIFVLGSLYRNFLSAYFISKGLTPGWRYFFLNVPVINLFVWISLLLRPAKPEDSFSASLSEKVGTETDQKILMAKDLQKKFVRDNRNNGIKLFIFLFIVLRSILKISGMDSRLIGSDQGDPVLFSLLTLLSLGLTIWYFSHKKALYVLFAIQSLLLLVIGVFQFESMLQLTTTSAMINMMIYYALFHFDKLNFVNFGIDSDIGLSNKGSVTTKLSVSSD